MFDWCGVRLFPGRCDAVRENEFPLSFVILPVYSVLIIEEYMAILAIG